MTTAPRPRLASRIWDQVRGAPDAEPAEERSRRIRAAIWHKLGWAVLDPAEIDSEWLRQAVTTEAETLYGRRGRR